MKTFNLNDKVKVSFTGQVGFVSSVRVESEFSACYELRDQDGKTIWNHDVKMWDHSTLIKL